MSRAVTTRHGEFGDVAQKELILADNPTGAFASATLECEFWLDVPDLAVADISVAYAAGGHRAADKYYITAQRKNLSGDSAVQALQSVTEGERTLPEQWRVYGPIFVKVVATITGNGPTATGVTRNNLLAGVVLSPSQPMCPDEWQKRIKACAMTAVKVY